MRRISQEDIIQLEKLIYLPMVLTVLAIDRNAVLSGSFKLERPYIEKIDRAAKLVHADLLEVRVYTGKRDTRVLKGRSDKTFTEYVFYHGGYEEHRRYLNLRLRNRTEELMRIYFTQAELKKST